MANEGVNFPRTIGPIERISHNIQPQRVQEGQGFGELLREQLDKNSPLRFSKHANERAAQRDIDISGNLLTNLNDAIAKARNKGAKDLVVISDKAAFIVNIPNNTVITALSGSELKENIFTNIDSAVLI